VVKDRRGRLGCLVTLMLLALVLYYGLPVVRVYWDYYQLIDEMQTTARFANSLSDNDITSRLRSTVDRLGLPGEAKLFTILRTQVPARVTIRTRYREVIELPFHQRTLTFQPRAEFRP